MTIRTIRFGCARLVVVLALAGCGKNSDGVGSSQSGATGGSGTSDSARDAFTGNGGTGGDAATGGGPNGLPSSFPPPPPPGSGVLQGPPAWVELVDGPSYPPPPPPTVLYGQDFSGYPADTPPSVYAVSHADNCSTDCAEGLGCRHSRRENTVGGSDCGALAAAGVPGAQASGSCFTRPPQCTRDCPIVCGCDGNFYCNACIANAWGLDIASYHPRCGETPTSTEGGL
jgi:hypothetical protein